MPTFPALHQRLYEKIKKLIDDEIAEIPDPPEPPSLDDVPRFIVIDEVIPMAQFSTTLPVPEDKANEIYNACEAWVNGESYTNIIVNLSYLDKTYRALLTDIERTGINMFAHGQVYPQTGTTITVILQVQRATTFSPVFISGQLRV